MNLGESEDAVKDNYVPWLNSWRMWRLTGEVTVSGSTPLLVRAYCLAAGKLNGSCVHPLMNHHRSQPSKLM